MTEIDHNKDLIQKFVNSFKKAVQSEMSAMREQMGPFEITIDNGQKIEAPQDSRYRFYRFNVPIPNNKLILNGECTLRHNKGEHLVTITAINGNKINIRSDQEIRLNSHSFSLVIYPWFLYERLLSVLESLPDLKNFHSDTALTLFGKIKPWKQDSPENISSSELNRSQTKAVKLCCNSNLSFVWGPPGTGKTTTLGHIVAELLNQGHRILVTSTTNAAVDQALTKISTLESLSSSLADGTIVRVGQTDAETYGTALNEVVRRQNEDLRNNLIQLREKRDNAAYLISECSLLLERLTKATRQHQLDMFSNSQQKTVTIMDLTKIFSRRFAETLLKLPLPDQQRLVEQRKARMEKSRDLCKKKIEESNKKLQGKEKTVIRNARVVLATMTNMYISQLLIEERFDVVIVEEAGMAILPTLFYCAGLGSKKIIAVGDPRQLPPIVQSRELYVHKAMGRGIFQVTVPEPHISDNVIMLDTQYRMHPVIGSLVSELFYDSRLVNDLSTEARQGIADKSPYAGKPLLVIDTSGKTKCSTHEGSFSRVNEQSAQICIDLASKAIADGIQSIAIITPYVQQSQLIRKLLAKSAIPKDQVESRTVHKFQGNERDMVILDTVDTQPLKPGVLLAGSGNGSSAPNLINVSISRAKGKLIIVSDVSYFQSNASRSAIDQVLSHAIKIGDHIIAATTDLIK